MSGFENMLTEVTAGSVVNPAVYFILPAELNLTGAAAAYALVDANNIIWVSGLADLLDIQPISSTENKIKVSSVLNIPENIATDSRGTKYQIRWLMMLSDGSRHSASEFVTILPKVSGQVGVLDVVDMEKSTIMLQAVLPDSGPATLDIYKQNNTVYTAANVNAVGSSHSGYNFEYSLALTDKFPAQLSPYTIVWSYGSLPDREVGRLYVINPSILSALRELNTYLNRLNRKARLEELTFTTPDLLTFLSGGADMFNATDYYTSFTFTNAQQSFRHFWLVCSQIVALRTRYLEEGESSFDFSGQAISLNVDITSYIEAQISALESWRDANLPGFKKQLHKRGILTGDASSVRYIARTRGVAGLTKNPVSHIGLSNSNFRIR